MLRLGEIVVIHDLKRQGLSVSAIARQIGLDRKTVRRYLARGIEPPVYGPRPPTRENGVDSQAWLTDVLARIADTPLNRLPHLHHLPAPQPHPAPRLRLAEIPLLSPTAAEHSTFMPQ